MGQVEDDLALYQILFDMELSISESFPSLNPIALRKEKAREVFTLLSRWVEKKTRKEPGKRVLRRPAGDTWF